MRSRRQGQPLREHPGPRQVTLSRLPGLSHPHQRLVQAAHNSQEGLASSHRLRHGWPGTWTQKDGGAPKGTLCEP